MPSGYPGALDTLATNHADGANEVISSATLNDLADAVNKIEAELGINPRGSSASLVARLAAIDAALSGHTTSINANTASISSHAAGSGLGSHIPAAGVADAHVAGSAAIAQSKISGLVAALAGKLGALGGLADQTFLTQAAYDALGAGRPSGRVYLIPAAGGTTFTDNFTRTVTDALTTSTLHADTGQDWTIQTGGAANFDVDGNAATFVHTAVSTSGIAYVPLSFAQQTLTGRFSYGSVPTAGAYVFSVIGRYTPAAGSMYRCKVTCNPAASAMTLVVEKQSSNTGNVLTPVAGTSVTLTGSNYAANDEYYVTLDLGTPSAGSSTVRVKVWKNGTTQPSAWTVDTTDNDSVLQAAANFGFYSVVTGTAAPVPVTLKVHDYAGSLS